MRRERNFLEAIHLINIHFAILNIARMRWGRKTTEGGRKNRKGRFSERIGPLLDSCDNVFAKPIKENLLAASVLQ